MKHSACSLVALSFAVMALHVAIQFAVADNTLSTDELIAKASQGDPRAQVSLTERFHALFSNPNTTPGNQPQGASASSGIQVSRLSSAFYRNPKR